MLICGYVDMWICGYVDMRIHVCGYADMRICGYADMLICWYADMLICWICWYADMLICWYADMLICWYVDVLCVMWSVVAEWCSALDSSSGVVIMWVWILAWPVAALVPLSKTLNLIVLCKASKSTQDTYHERERACPPCFWIHPVIGTCAVGCANK